MAFTRHEKGGIIYYTSPLFDHFEVPHFFCTRFGGVSTGAFDSLNFSSVRKDSNGKTDTAENIRENLKRALSVICSDESECAMMKQIHSADVERVKINCKTVFDGEGTFQPCDAIFAPKGNKEDTVCVKTADCVPILLYDTVNDIPCAIHAGWRGSVSDIAGNAVRAIIKVYPDANIIAAIGPHINACCYEVNGKVFDALIKSADEKGINKSTAMSCFEDSYMKDGEQKYTLSLERVNGMFLENEGVPKENISKSGICTACKCDEFFSHRAWHGFSGTQLSAVKRKVRK